MNRDRLRDLIDASRIERSWTLEQFAEHAGLGTSTVYYARASQERREPSLITLGKLAKVLGCTVEDFTVPDPPGQQELDLPLPSEKGVTPTAR